MRSVLRLARADAVELQDCLACLPAEAEWEYACCGGSGVEHHQYYTGDGEATTRGGYVWWGLGDRSTASAVEGRQRFHLFDLHGNVWEWCHDAWDERAYRTRVDGLKDPGRDTRREDYRSQRVLQTVSRSDRVLRGGSWFNTARLCRSAFRFGFWAGDRLRNCGFRVCLLPGPVYPD
jgi:formylglycine-generating enzyme required for sulfatase activity